MDNLKLCRNFINRSESTLTLTNVSLEKVGKEIPPQVALGISREYSNIEMSKNALDVMITTRLIGFNVLNEDEEASQGEYELSNEEVSFQIEVTYDVSIRNKEIDKYEPKDKDNQYLIKDYAWFLLYPTLKDNINYLVNKMGLSNIDIPYNVSDSGDGDGN